MKEDVGWLFVGMQDTRKYSTYKLHARSVPHFVLPFHMKGKACDLPKKQTTKTQKLYYSKICSLLILILDFEVDTGKW